ncbi:hypothetical protein [Pseudonocardia sp. NPDC049154]|uniref:hypothetical protein n=1 Tax=Pseudonocardia sp. NPDC049154 TaxID=3155501 RepID=UPI00340EF4D9
MDAVPGFVPRVLRDSSVGLFRAEDRVFEAMVDGWRAQMLARGLVTATIETRTRLVVVPSRRSSYSVYSIT